MLKKIIKNVEYILSDVAEVMKVSKPGSDTLLVVPTSVQSTAYYTDHHNQMRH